MPKSNPKKLPRVFISHSSVNLDVAEQVEAVLKEARFDPWLDHSDIRVGALLGKQLQPRIRRAGPWF